MHKVCKTQICVPKAAGLQSKHIQTAEDFGSDCPYPYVVVHSTLLHYVHLLFFSFKFVEPVVVAVTKGRAPAVGKCYI